MERETEGNSTDEIEITPEMIEAGIEALCARHADDPYDEVVKVIYLSMETLRRIENRLVDG
jgi:hypothetical protein